MNVRRYRRSLSLLAAALLVGGLAACTGDSAQPSPTGEAPSATGEAPSPTGDDAPSSDPESTEPAGGAGVAPVPSIGAPVDGTPLAEYLPALAALRTATAASSDESRASWWEKSQGAIAECMSDEGFEYVPVEYRSPAGFTAPIISQSYLHVPRLPADRADVERFGYGVDREGGLDWAPAPDSPAEQQNAATYEALSDEGKRAYELAFNGYDGDPESTQAFDSSCAGRAAADHPEPTVDPTTVAAGEYESLQGDIGSVWTYDVAQDPRTISLNEQWSACMADAGLPLVEDFRDVPGPDPVTAFQLALNTGPDGEQLEGAVDMATEDIPVENRTMVGSQPERDIALADFDCRAQLDYEATLTDVVIEHESDFVEANEERLEGLLAAAELLES